MKKVIGVVLFDQFELLDVFGPLEMFGLMKDQLEVKLISQDGGTVTGSANVRVLTDFSFKDSIDLNVLIIPGGIGTRTEVHNNCLLEWLAAQGVKADIIACVCTGSALLAKTCLLDGKRATTNKMAFSWVTQQNTKVKWIKTARWVEDGNIFTSSGVSAGTDMSLALIARLFDYDTAQKVADMAEYNWCSNWTADPFARLYGLV